MSISPLHEAVRIERDVVYGHGVVASTSAPRARALTLDLYRPPGTTDRAPRPALVLAFGGAFHRGSKENDAFEVGGYRNTAIAQYCEAFARRGYVCASVGYRLVTEDPDPEPSGAVARPADIPRSRVDQVREQLGLPPATSETLWRGVEAAANDLAAAFLFLRADARAHGIDPARMAVGGWSAGARTALNAAFAKRVPARAVISLSGFMATTDLQRLIRPGDAAPATLLVWGEHDLDYVSAQGPLIADHLRRSGVDVEALTLQGETHFYPSTASAGPPGSSLEAAMAAFLHERLNGERSEEQSGERSARPCSGGG